MSTLRFDQVVSSVSAILAESPLERAGDITIVRDSLGVLTVVLPDDAWADAAKWNTVAERLHDKLGLYSPGEKEVLLRQRDLIDLDDVIRSPDRVRLPDVANTWLVDRLLTNQDWLRKPLSSTPPMPTAVAFSIKGGVGRTTAFALWAWSLARAGKNIVLVDLDLEAPGVAGLLLDETRLPDYGLADWLVDALVEQPDEALLQDCLVTCALANGTAGKIRVLPAFGSKTRDYLNKLGRIYMPTFDSNSNRFVGLAERLMRLLEQLAQLPDRPDAILLDARAGFHDIGSAAVTRLGAEVFLFTRNDSQSRQAYTQLFTHLCMAQSVTFGMPDDDLRWKLKMVGAQQKVSASFAASLREACYDLWSDTLYDEEESRPAGDNTPVAATFGRDDDNAPHLPLAIQFDPRVGDFDLRNEAEQPDWRVIETAFGDFFAGATKRLFPDPVGALS
jgi:cellulose biosynthesis protein BcsQ